MGKGERAIEKGNRKNWPSAKGKRQRGKDKCRRGRDKALRAKRKGQKSQGKGGQGPRKRGKRKEQRGMGKRKSLKMIGNGKKATGNSQKKKVGKAAPEERCFSLLPSPFDPAEAMQIAASNHFSTFTLSASTKKTIVNNTKGNF